MRMTSHMLRADVMAGAAVGVLFAIGFAAFFAFTGGPRLPVLAIVATAVLAGVLFGLFIAIFQRSGLVRAQVRLAVADGETVLADGPANHFLRFEGRGGWLYLTDRRLSFQPHRINLQTAPLDIALADIVGAEPSRLLGIVPTGLVVRTRLGKAERFSVHGRRQWAQMIRERLSAPR